MKKLVSLALILALCLTLAVPAMAAETVTITDDAGIVATITNVTRSVGFEESEWYYAGTFWCSGETVITLGDSWGTVKPFEDSDERTLGPASMGYSKLTEQNYAGGTSGGDYTNVEGRSITLSEGIYGVDLMYNRPPYGDISLQTICVFVEAAEEAPAPSSTGFQDVPAGAYYEEAVKWAVEKEITTGTTATTFSPAQTCTQAQILTFLWRAKGSPEPATAPDSTEYYAKAAQWAKEQGITDEFDPTAPCTRAMTVDYLWKAAGKPQTEGKTAFEDVEEGTDLASAVAWAVKAGVTTGTSETTFTPGQICNRGQIVTFLYRNLK